MSYKSQLSLSSRRQHMAIAPSWGLSPANMRDMKLVSPWIEYDSSVRPGLASRRLKWNAVLGIGLATAVSASIWTGIVIVAAHILR
jgi:hypothetical protein